MLRVRSIIFKFIAFFCFFLAFLFFPRIFLLSQLVLDVSKDSVIYKRSIEMTGNYLSCHFRANVCVEVIAEFSFFSKWVCNVSFLYQHGTSNF